jgi:hypothetical protein
MESAMPEIRIDDNHKLLLDKNEFEIANKYIWHIFKQRNSLFIYTLIDDKECSFKEIVLKTDKDKIVYHKNNNPFDFRCTKIKIINRQEYFHFVRRNYKKSSKYGRVYFDSDNKRWGVRVVKGKGYFGGRYESEFDAAIVADFLSIQLYGAIAQRNFPDISIEELYNKYHELEIKYGFTPKEKQAKTVQGVSYRAGNKSSKYVGVYRNKRKNRWEAEIRYLKRRYWLGLHDAEEDAARAYDKKAIELYGIGARLNFPDPLARESM